MYVVFWTLKRGFIDFHDEYEICANEDDARAMYRQLLELDDLYCAGWTKITGEATDDWIN